MIVLKMFCQLNDQARTRMSRTMVYCWLKKKKTADCPTYHLKDRHHEPCSGRGTSMCYCILNYVKVRVELNHKTHACVCTRGKRDGTSA